VDAIIGVSPLTFLLASAVLTITPGPDMTLVARNTIAQGRGAGMQTAAGAIGGVSVHVLAAVAGLSAVLTSSAQAFAVVKVAGVAYLLYLGVRALLDSRHVSGDAFDRAPPRLVASPSSPVTQGFLSALLNPKLGVFFLTFLPQFVDPDRMPELSMLAHGAVFMVMGATWLTLWTLSLDRVGTTLRKASVRAWIERAAGAALIGMGVRLAFARR